MSETQQPSYLKAFLSHPWNKAGLLAAGAVGVFASIPLGTAGLVLAGLGALAVEVAGGLIVPALPPFRRAVDQAHRKAQRDARVAQYFAQLQGLGDSVARNNFAHMQSRVGALYSAVAGSQGGLAVADVDKLDELTVDYLGLAVLGLTLAQRKDAANEAFVTKRIGQLEAQLKEGNLRDEEARQVKSALADFNESLARSRRLGLRRTSIEATLVGMPDKIEEVYQLVMSAPFSKDSGSRLEESLARLRIAEEVAAEFKQANLELEAEPAPTIKPKSQAAPPSLDAARRAAAARN